MINFIPKAVYPVDAPKVVCVPISLTSFVVEAMKKHGKLVHKD